MCRQNARIETHESYQRRVTSVVLRSGVRIGLGYINTRLFIDTGEDPGPQKARPWTRRIFETSQCYGSIETRRSNSVGVL